MIPLLLSWSLAGGRVPDLRRARPAARALARAAASDGRARVPGSRRPARGDSARFVCCSRLGAACARGTGGAGVPRLGPDQRARRGWRSAGALRLLRAPPRPPPGRIQDALVEAIEQVRDAIRTGLSVPDALAGLARTGPGRAATGVRRPSSARARLVGFEAALIAHARSTGRSGVRCGGAALVVNDRLGGRQVSQVLDRLAEATRAQLRIQQEVRAQQGRTVLSARIVAAAPVVALIGLRATNPRYLSRLRHAGGQIVLLGLRA